jgi:hypothetical protein
LAGPCTLYCASFSESGKKLLDRISSGSIKAGGAEVAFEALVQSAATQDVSQQVTAMQVTPLPLVSIEEAEKAAIADIPQFIQRKVQVLDFTLGSG